MEEIAIGADDAGLSLKESIKAYLHQLGYKTCDYGVQQGDTTYYPDIAFQVASAIADSKFSRGMLFCGTGIGMAIVANKVAGVRAAVCHDGYSAERARRSNNAQILTMGAKVIAPELAKTIIDVWLASEFAGGASAEKVNRIESIERIAGSQAVKHTDH